MNKLLISLLAICLFAIPGQTFALSCAEPSPIPVAYDEYDAVLIGSVEEINQQNGVVKLIINVEKSFKGVQDRVITVSEDATWGESQKNAAYLFFLTKENEKWKHPLCSPTIHKTGLADEFFADKQQLVLHDVNTGASKPDGLLKFIVAAAAIIIGLIIFKIKQTKKVS